MRTLAILILAFVSSTAFAQTNVRVRGTITALNGDVLMVKSRDGRDIQLHLTPDAQVVNVHVLDADGAAVSVAQALEEAAQREWSVVLKRFALDRQLHVRLGEPQKLGLKFWRNRLRQAERVHLRNPVAAHTVEADEQVNAILEGRTDRTGSPSRGARH